MLLLEESLTQKNYFKGECMNILKEFAKIFIKSKLDDEKRKLKEKLQKQIITTTSTSVVARNVAYLGIVDKLDGKGIAEVNKIIDKI